MFKLKEILAKDPADLTSEEKAFLRSKMSKLSDDDKEKFADCLKAEEDGGDDEDEDEDEEGLDEDAVKALVTGAIDEAMEKKLEARVDDIAKSIVEKFMAGAKKSRSKVHADKKVEKDQTADEKTREFMKALLNGDRARCKALTTSTSGSDPDDAQAGLLIPPELMAEVLRIKEEQFGLARRDFRYLPFSGPGNSRTIPSLGTSVNVFWTGEGVKKTSTQPKFNLITQTLKKLAAIVPMTEEILEDSAINLTSLIAELFAEATAKEEDIQFFAGTGSPWTGILNNGDVGQVTQASGGVDDITADDLLDLVDETPTGALNGAKYYMHRTVFSKIRKLKDSQGNYIYQRPSGDQPGTIWNYPYELSDAFPTAADVETDDAYVLFGNLKNAAVFGDKQQLRVKLLDQATVTDTDGTTVINLAEQDMVALRVVERVGYVLALPTAVTVLVAGEPAS